nr:MAG TPA: hypothetical protein [Caudoviricetes sp.]DAS95266.1 MAG TPA: hypothetical protein [Caudoviricetes sp.]
MITEFLYVVFAVACIYGIGWICGITLLLFCRFLAFFAEKLD